MILNLGYGLSCGFPLGFSGFLPLPKNMLVGVLVTLHLPLGVNVCVQVALRRTGVHPVCIPTLFSVFLGLIPEPEQDKMVSKDE